MPLIATRGAASAQGFGEFAQTTEPVYIESVFSTWLYTGNGSTQTITNNIDLSTKGGLVWVKSRAAASHFLYDTVRGVNKYLMSNATDSQTTQADSLTAFNTTGFSIGNALFNDNAVNYASWTFREQPKFFDVVTYTGNQTARTISHNLGSVPGFIITKQYSGTGGDWCCYHRSLGASKGIFLNDTGGESSSSTFWNATSPTSTEFSLGTATDTNKTGETFVAYLFAHNAGGFGLTGSDNVISCGSFTADNAGGGAYSGGATVNLGYEPQFVLIKETDSTLSDPNWIMVDTFRGYIAQQTSGSDVGQQRLRANTSGAENNAGGCSFPTSTGFSALQLTGGATYIYIAIRRGPMKTPTSGTSVFYPQAISQADSIDSTNVPFPPDLINTFSRDGTNRTNKFSYFQFVDRLRGAGTPNDTRVAASEGLGLVSSGTDAEYGQANPPGFTYVQLKANSQDITRGTGWNSASYGNWINYFFRRAPGFFDVVCYDGNSTSGRTVSHNLGVAPELIIVKSRNTATNWGVYCQPLGNTKRLILNLNVADNADSTYWNNTSPTSSVFYVGNSPNVNATTQTYVAYLFATVAGVSKVGSYTGTGALQTVNCGFTGGARFVLIKRTDSTGDWWVYDSARGITSGNDPYLFLNSTAAEVTNTNYVDTTSTGFQVTAAAPAGLNANGGNFIFLAVA